MPNEYLKHAFKGLRFPSRLVTMSLPWYSFIAALNIISTSSKNPRKRIPWYKKCITFLLYPKRPDFFIIMT